MKEIGGKRKKTNPNQHEEYGAKRQIKEASGSGLSDRTEDARMQRLMNDDVNKTNNADAKNSFTLAPHCALDLTTVRQMVSTRLDQILLFNCPFMIQRL